MLFSTFYLHNSKKSRTFAAEIMNLHNFTHMKQNLLLFCALVCGTLAYAESLVIQTMGQSERLQALETVGRLEFDQANRQVFLVLKDSTVAETYSFEEIRKLYFSDSEDLQSVNESAKVKIENNLLVVEGIDAPTTLRVFSMTGQLMIQKTGFSIGVEGLPNGAYILQFNQGIVKFIKE